jgi:hypothetical protein
MVLYNIDEMNENIDNMHHELLELVVTLSDGTISDRSSSVCALRF